MLAPKAPPVPPKRNYKNRLQGSNIPVLIPRKEYQEEEEKSEPETEKVIAGTGFNLVRSLVQEQQQQQQQQQGKQPFQQFSSQPQQSQQPRSQQPVQQIHPQFQQQHHHQQQQQQEQEQHQLPPKVKSKSNETPLSAPKQQKQEQEQQQQQLPPKQLSSHSKSQSHIQQQQQQLLQQEPPTPVPLVKHKVYNKKREMIIETPPPSLEALWDLWDLKESIPDVIIGEEVEIKGEFQFEGLLHLHGRFEGRLISTTSAAENIGDYTNNSEQELSGGDIYIGPKGILKSTIENMQRILIEGGKVIGNIQVDSLKIVGGSLIRGNIVCRHLEIDSQDAIIQGKVYIHPYAPTVVEFPKERKPKIVLPALPSVNMISVVNDPSKPVMQTEEAYTTTTSTKHEPLISLAEQALRAKLEAKERRKEEKLKQKQQDELKERQQQVKQPSPLTSEVQSIQPLMSSKKPTVIHSLDIDIESTTHENEGEMSNEIVTPRSNHLLALETNSIVANPPSESENIVLPASDYDSLEQNEKIRLVSGHIGDLEFQENGELASVNIDDDTEEVNSLREQLKPIESVTEEEAEAVVISAQDIDTSTIDEIKEEVEVEANNDDNANNRNLQMNNELEEQEGVVTATEPNSISPQVVDTVDDHLHEMTTNDTIEEAKNDESGVTNELTNEHIDAEVVTPTESLIHEKDYEENDNEAGALPANTDSVEEDTRQVATTNNEEEEEENANETEHNAAEEMEEVKKDPPLVDGEQGAAQSNVEEDHMNNPTITSNENNKRKTAAAAVEEDHSQLANEYEAAAAAGGGGGDDEDDL
jgi:cytoskeletal protein CcmA (bactofilin family)